MFLEPRVVILMKIYLSRFMDVISRGLFFIGCKWQIFCADK